MQPNPKQPQQPPTNPMAGRIIENKQNNISQSNYDKYRPLSLPTEQANTETSYNQGRKPLITPIRHYERYQQVSKEKQRVFNGGHYRSRSDRAVRHFCVNHGGKDAEFRLVIEDQRLHYCVKCAVKLASQGFLVQKLQQQPRSTPPSFPTTHNPTHNPNPNPSSQNYHHITEFLRQLSQTEQKHHKQMQKLSQIDRHYRQQYEYTEYFYQELLCFIQQMRDDHLGDLEQQGRRDSQIADIQEDYLRGNLEEIGVIWRDIEANLDNIVQKMPEDDLKTNLKFYRYKMQVYGHKIEELQEFFAKVISFKEEEYHLKLNRVQQYIMSIWKTDQANQTGLPGKQTKSEIITSNFMEYENRNSLPKRHSQNLTIKPSQLLKQPQQQKQNPRRPPPKQKKSTAFRILFTQDDHTASTSPQFKNL